MIRLLVLLLTVLTGFSGLVYEVTWQRYLATLLGSHSEATAAVLGLFLGGLALGYSVFGALTRRIVARAAAAGRPAPLLIVYGMVEASIGLFALIFPLLFAGVQALSFRIPHGSAGLGFALDVMLSALLVLPPAVLMGGTIPILTQALARSLEDATRFHALVYAFNTAGAFAGALAAGYWLVPSLGLVKVLIWMGGINLLAGASFLALGWLRPPAAEPVATAVTPAPEARLRGAGWFAFAAVALLVGFAMMTLQTVLIRLGAVSFGSSQFTFSMVVAVFVLCIALGSFAVSALPRIPAFLLPACLWTLLLALLLLYRGAESLPYWAYALRTLFANEDASFTPYFVSAFGGLLAVIGIPVALSGAVLPLMFHALRDRVGDLGDVAGRLYSWNTLGSLLGALIGGYALLFWLDLHHTFRIAMGAIAVAAGLTAGSRRRALAGALGAGSLLAIAALPAWRPERLNAGLFQTGMGPPQIVPASYLGPDRFFAEFPLTQPPEQGGRYAWVFHDDDPNSSVTVTERRDAPRGHGRDLRNSGRPEGGTDASDKTMRLAGLLPALFANQMERAFVIGYGLGMTAGELASLSSVREVVVAEISPGVIEAAPLFDEESLGASHQPSIRIVNSDAYRALLRSQGRFDAIVSSPSHTWVAGVEMLFSREFLEAARNRLAPGGVYLQWFLSNGLESEPAEPTAMALRTFASVFPAVAVWYGRGFELLILGMNDERNALDLDRIDRLSRRRDISAGLARAGIPDLPALLAHELLPVGVVSAARLPGPLHTLLHPQLGTLAARAFFTGREALLPATADLESASIGSTHSLQRRFAERFGGRLPESERGRLIGQICLHRPRECQTQLAAWTREVPESPVREIVLRQLREGSKGRINPASVPALLPLFGTAAADSGPVTPADAARDTDLFLSYYTHATPFPRAVLAEVWRRCQADPAHPDACREGRAAAELRLGALDARLAETPDPVRPQP